MYESTLVFEIFIKGCTGRTCRPRDLIYSHRPKAVAPQHLHRGSFETGPCEPLKVFSQRSGIPFACPILIDDDRLLIVICKKTITVARCHVYARMESRRM